MAEAQAKPQRVEEVVKMEDGRDVTFVGTRRILKDTLVDESKIALDGELLVVQPGALAIRMDFRNGSTRTYPIPNSLLVKFAGHGGEQKFGDELAVPKDKDITLEDLVLWADDLGERIAKGEWRTQREGSGDSFAGASVVIRALMEATGKDGATIKAFLQGKLDSAKAKGEALTRKQLYDSFKNPETKVGAIIARLEKERIVKDAKVDADAELAALMAQ